MNRRLITSTFVVGVIALAVWVTFSILWMMHIELRSMTFSFDIAAIAIMVLLALGLIFRARDRWLAFTLAAILLIGFSVSWLYSLGGFLWPFGVLLLINSLIKLNQYRRAVKQD